VITEHYAPAVVLEAGGCDVVSYFAIIDGYYHERQQVERVTAVYVALEFDHAIVKPQIRWIVVDCADVGRKCGGPIALPPRVDVAYFVHPDTAERDARLFAGYKQRGHDNESTELDRSLRLASTEVAPAHHYAYPWDHLVLNAWIRWAVLTWSGDADKDGPRIDTAYFVHPATAEQDALLFAQLREQAQEATVGTSPETVVAGEGLSRS
jgi:hypothetical protein